MARLDDAAPISGVRVVLFDAVGTLIYANPPVAAVYRAAALQRGIDLGEAEIESRFRQALAAGGARGETLATSEAGERRRWRAIVCRVFDEAPEPAIDELFDALWDHFADSRHWSVYDDVAPAWQALRERGLHVGVASNFDQRLAGICARLDPLTSADSIFYSSDLGCAKPGLEFFRTVQQRLGRARDEILLVGDDPINDHQGARAAGWHAMLIDRAGGRRDSIHSLTHTAELLA